MKTTTRFTSFAAALTLGLSSALGAQSLATFGSVEVAGFGEGSALLGTSLSSGRAGWGPVANLVGQTYRYRNGINSHAQAYALSPSFGLQYAMSDGSVGAMVGYTFVNTEFGGIVSGAEAGGRNGPFVSAQATYWGNGENSAQVIGSYGFESEYYWTRFRASHRLAPSEKPIYVGGELVLQGSQIASERDASTLTSTSLRTPFRYQIGPTIEYRLSPDFRVGASGGYRGGSNRYAGSGYARIEFLLLTKLNSM